MTGAMSKSPHIVAIGGAAGAIEALCKLLALLPAGLPAIVLATVHRRVYAESHLKEMLARHAQMRVIIPEEGELLIAGACYIGHPSSHLTVGPGLRARFVGDGLYRAHNIDALFTSAARRGGDRVIGVILSGMSSDGTEGLAAIKEEGGTALVQSPAEALWDQMPLSAIHNDGRVDFVGTIREIAHEICRLATATSAQVQSDNVQSESRNDPPSLINARQQSTAPIRRPQTPLGSRRQSSISS
jgi:two-component system chemotaxis response regulator CheB